MIPSESPNHSQTTEAATHKQNDRFLYQRRVSEKISAFVSGKLELFRNGVPLLRAFPGNEQVIDPVQQRRVPVEMLAFQEKPV